MTRKKKKQMMEGIFGVDNPGALCLRNGYWLQPKRVRRRLAAARFGQGQYDSMPEYPVRWYHCKVKSTLLDRCEWWPGLFSLSLWFRRDGLRVSSGDTDGVWSDW